jgi:hypothetical protein
MDNKLLCTEHDRHIAFLVSFYFGMMAVYILLYNQRCTTFQYHRPLIEYTMYIIWMPYNIHGMIMLLILDIILSMFTRH